MAVLVVLVKHAVQQKYSLLCVFCYRCEALHTDKCCISSKRSCRPISVAISNGVL